MRSSRIAEIIRSVQALAEPIHVHGASSAARALLAARFAYETPGAVVVVCPDDDQAQAFAADLETLSSTVDDHALSVLTLPTWEQSPFSPIAPSIRTRLDRLRVFSQMREASEKTIIVSTI